MSYPGLVLDTDNAQTTAEQFFQEIVLFVVDGGSAQTSDTTDRIQPLSFGVAFCEVGIPGSLDSCGDLLHRPIHRFPLPAVGVGSSVEHFGDPVRIDGQLEGVGTLGAERALVDRIPFVSLDIDELSRFGIGQLSAADSAVRTDGLRDGCVAQP